MKNETIAITIKYDKAQIEKLKREARKQSVDKQMDISYADLIRDIVKYYLDKKEF